jgi:hypothetical protein
VHIHKVMHRFVGYRTFSNTLQRATNLDGFRGRDKWNSAGCSRREQLRFEVTSVSSSHVCLICKMWE